MEFEYSVDELFPKCKIKPRPSAQYDSDSEPEANERLSKEDFCDYSDDSASGNIRKYNRKCSGSIEYREEAEGQEDYDSREEGEGEEEEDGKRQNQREEEEEENGGSEDGEQERRQSEEVEDSEFSDTEEEIENEIQDHGDEDVDGDYDDDSIDHFQRHKSRRSCRSRKSLRKFHHGENGEENFVDSEDECIEQLNNEAGPSLRIEEAGCGARRKCVPHRGFWKRTKDNIESGISNIWDKIKDGSRGIRSRLRNDWGKKHQKKLSPLHEDANSYEGEDEEDTSSKFFREKPK